MFVDHSLPLSVFMKSPERTRKATRRAAFKNPLLVRRSEQHHATTTRAHARTAKRLRNEQPWLESVPDNGLPTDAPIYGEWVIVDAGAIGVPDAPPSSFFTRLLSRLWMASPQRVA